MMNIEINTVKDLAQSLTYIVIVIVLPIITAFAKNFWEARKKQTVILAENSELDNTIKHVITMIVDAIHYTNQVYVDNIKEQAEDHKLTHEEMKIAYQKTFQRIQDLLPEASRKVLEAAYGNVDLWIQTEIEAIINGMN